VAATKKRKFGRWLYQCNAHVISCCKYNGDQAYYARVSIPSVKTPYSYEVKSKSVTSIAAGWEWIRKLADDWAEKENVEWL